jgi:hypothetical protein
MKAKIEFNLPEDESNFKLATCGFELWKLLYELDMHCRSKLKHQELNDVEHKVYEEIREFIYSNGWYRFRDLVE